jgi:hypothetical protein
MHRSGTSAMTRLINLLGADLGKKLLEPQLGVNDEGFWENSAVVDANEDILQRFSSAWYDVRGIYYDGYTEEIIHNIKGVINGEFQGVPIAAIKDPRLCRLAPFWVQALKQCNDNWSPKFVSIVRNPMEVAQSLDRRDGLSLASSFWLWIDYVLCSERYSRGYERLFFTYDQLLAYPEFVAEQLSRVLGVGWPLEDPNIGKQITSEITAKHRHHSEKKWTPSNELQSLAFNLYQLFSLHDKPPVATEFDLIWGEFRSLVSQNHLGLEAAHLANSAYFTNQRRLSDIGGQLSQAQKVVQKRDLQLSELQTNISSLGKQHSYAINLVAERDAQLKDLQMKYEALGKEHSYAISVVEERDLIVKEQIQILEERNLVIRELNETVSRIYNIPVIGSIAKILKINNK